MFDFDLYYCKGSSNGKEDALSRCPEFTSREVGTTESGDQMLVKKEQWPKVGEMQIEEEHYKAVNIAAFNIE